MDVSELLDTTAGCLEELSKEDDLDVTAGLQEAIREAAMESKEELDCKNPLAALSGDHLLTFKKPSTHLSRI